MKIKFINPKFIKSAVLSKDYPKITNEKGHILPEIGIAGRSNVGKSSLLNHLFHSKNLVKVSCTPGKTQLLNFFSLNQQIAFVDLPGYGFAKVSQEVKKNWGPMVQEYLQTRDSLKLILFLLDIRRIPNDEDLQLLSWMIYTQKAMILVLTKVDKVSQGERISQTKKILETLNCSSLHYVHYSTLKNEGREPLMKLIEQALNEECS